MENRFLQDSQKMKDIKTYLNGLNFKRKIIGGCDKEDVFEKINVVTLMFREAVEEAEASRLKACQQLEEVQAKISNRAEQNESELMTLRSEQKKNIERIQALTAKLEAASKNKKNYQEKAYLLTETMMEQEQRRGEIITAAEREAQKILLQAEDKAQAMVRQRWQELEQMLDEKQYKLEQIQRDILEAGQEKNAVSFEIKASMRMIQEETAQIQKKTEDLMKKMHEMTPVDPEPSGKYPLRYNVVE